jgi:NAD-dependent dihydropyrimidine dehydrogenase PreA subunit
LAAIGGFDAHRTLKTCATAEAWGKKRHFYKPLPTQFRHDGFEYRLIGRERDAAIYEQRCGGCADPSVCYEVIRIRRREGFQIGARLVEAAEVYPNSEAWGVDGWTVLSRDAAFEKLREIYR